LRLTTFVKEFYNDDDDDDDDDIFYEHGCCELVASISATSTAPGMSLLR